MKQQPEQQDGGEAASPVVGHCFHHGKRRCLRHCREHGVGLGSPLVDDVSGSRAIDRRASADVVSDGKKTPENDRKVLSSPSSADSPFVGSPVLDIAVTNGSPRAVEAKRPHLCRLCNVCRKIAGLSPRKHHHGRKRRRGHRHGQEQQPARADSASTALGVRDVVKPVPLDEPFDLSIRKFSERPPGVASDIAETSFSPGGPSQPSATSSMSPSSPLLPEAAALPAAPAVDGRATNAVAAAAEPEQPCRVNQDRQVAKTPVKASFAADIGGFDGDERCKRDRSARRKRRRPSKRQQDNANESPSANSLPPMMSPGAATVLNIDAALLPKGPQTRLPDSLPMGRFQLMILACAQLSAAVDAYQILSARLLAPTVDHWCRPPAEYSHMSAEIWKNASVPLGSNGRYNQCAVYEQPFGPQHSGLSLEPQRPTVPCHSWDYDLPPGVQTMVSRWDLVCDYAWQVTFARIYHIISSFVMLPLAGQLSDKVGRRVVINFCVILAMCAGLAVAYAESFVVFVASRIFVSASASTLRINTLILLFEVVTPSYRDLYCCLVQLGHIVGSIVAASLEGGVVDVRIVEVVGIMPTSLLVFCFYAAEESPMWLLATWNFAKAKKVLLWMSRVNGVAVAIDIPDLSQHHRAKRTEEVRAVYRVSVLDMLTNETVRRRVGSMMCVWFCLLFAMHGVLLHTPRHNDVWLVLIAVVPRAAALPAAYTLLRGSSRKAALGMCVALSSCFSFSLAFLTLLAPPRNRSVTTLFCELTLSALSMTYTVVILYSLEMFPTVLRTMAVCTVIATGRVGAALSIGIDGTLEHFHRSAPLFLGALSLVAAQVALVDLPETKYSRLPNTLYDLEANVVKQVVLDILQQNSSPHNTAPQNTSIPDRKCQTTTTAP